MEQKYSITLVPDFEHSYIYDDASVFKTDTFVKQTSYALGIDEILDKIGETVIRNAKEINSLYGSSNYFEAQTDVGENTFRFVLKDKDVIFYDYLGSEIHRKDKRFIHLAREKYSIIISKIKDKEIALKKIYTLSFAEGINFPYLNKEQHEIVTISEGNILVQGVAGSGKTNVCIDRIIYAACMGFKGRILYSTYSRGLLIETQNKVKSFVKKIEKFLENIDSGRAVIYGDKIKAISNKLGIWISVPDSNNAIIGLKEILRILTENVDYLLINDIYNAVCGKTVQIADESFFIKEYVGNLKNYQLASNLEKIKNLSYEIIYKEIFGMISGLEKMPTEEEYISKRSGSFTSFEAKTIYYIAQDFFKFMESKGVQDNNTISNELLLNPSLKGKYYSVILDEVQDFTQINLQLFKYMSHRMFCVGDALQMINPSYFSFAYLKRMMFEENITDVKQLKNNYRNTAKLEDIIQNLNKINVDQFGTHSFVLDGVSVDTDVPTVAIYTDSNMLQDAKRIDLTNCTFVVASNQKKTKVHEMFPKSEVLTVSDIKGMERDTIVLLDVLSDNSEKWDKLYRDKVNKKIADENSAYRYWFNLMYVGISRAKRNLFVAERKEIKLFEDFLEENFVKLAPNKAIDKLGEIIGKARLDDDEIITRINEFLNLGQYDNARYAADNLSTMEETDLQYSRIAIHETDVKSGKYMDAGIRLWEIGLGDEAKEFFILANAEELCDMVDALQGENAKLDANIVKYYPQLESNDTARKLVLDTLAKDIENMKHEQRIINEKIKGIKARRKQ